MQQLKSHYLSHYLYKYIPIVCTNPITINTPYSLTPFDRISSEYPGLCVGAGLSGVSVDVVALDPVSGAEVGLKGDILGSHVGKAVGIGVGNGANVAIGDGVDTDPVYV